MNKRTCAFLYKKRHAGAQCAFFFLRKNILFPMRSSMFF
ncbi:hypothetical protein CHCC14814_1788 [Bacillus paralicheniformis]|nr:hypothetical protein CHCC14814_1788 [Bacillus paralicheniformis]